MSKTTLASVLFCLLAQIACAEELNFTVASIHFKDNASENNFNPGVGYGFSSSIFDPWFGAGGYDVIGAYYNSHRKASVYAGYYYPFVRGPQLDGLELGVMGAIATGYSPVMPAVLLVATYPVGKYFGSPGLNARATVVPLPDFGVLTFSIAYRF